MKKLIIENIEKIHRLTSLLINEDDFFSNATNKLRSIIDEPNKADYVTDNLNDFYTTLKKSADSGGIKQQSYGSMKYQKDVETLQIALTLLGFRLPKHGIDGLYGQETGNAVKEFKDKYMNQINESNADTLRTTLDDLGYNEKGNEITSGGDIKQEISNIVSEFLKELKINNPSITVTITSGNDKFHKQNTPNYVSKHETGDAIDFIIKPYNVNTSKIVTNLLIQYKSKYNNFNFIDEYKNPSSKSTGGHFHVFYDTKTTPMKNVVKNGTTDATSEMLLKIIDLLKQKRITDKDISYFIDKKETNQSSFFNLIDLKTSDGVYEYESNSQKILNNYKSNLLGIDGSMLANAAKTVYLQYNVYVPYELAIAQMTLEGGIGNSNKASRPIITKNPFNVGNTDNGKNKYFENVQDSINNYYKLMATKYLNKKSPDELLNNFVDNAGHRYAQLPGYENRIKNLIGKIKKNI